MGSKCRLAKEILPIVLKNRQEEQWYVEPFAGGMNSICHVDGNRIANDINEPLIEMWKHLVYNNWIPKEISRDEYNEIRSNKEKYPLYLVGWVGFNCSYSGKYFGGFAGETKTKIGTIRNYQQEAIRNVAKQVETMGGVVFKNKEYYDLEIPKNSIIYCDPPYCNTTGYSSKIKVDQFWDWVREMSKIGHSVYVSEYNAPSDFVCLWEKEVSSSLSANGVSGRNIKSLERLFVFEDSFL